MNYENPFYRFHSSIVRKLCN